MSWRICNLCNFLVAAGLSLSASAGAIAVAQQTTPPVIATDQPPPTSDVPTLPERNIVAEPPTVNLQPNFDPFDNTVISDNVFQAAPTRGYHAESSTTGSLIAIPNLALPGTVSTVSDQLRRDQQAFRFTEILRDIGGAVNTNNDQLRPDSFNIRGFEVQSTNFRKNGFLDQTYTPRDFANVERVEVFKGPASVMYCAADPAGTINLVTKKAQYDRFTFGTWNFGSNNLNRLAIDANSYSGSGNVLYRVNAAYENSDSFRNFGYLERVFVAPTVTFLLTPDTAFTWEGEYHQDRRMRDSGIIAVNGDARVFPEDRFFGAPTDFAEFHDYRSTMSFTHRFNDYWQFYLGGSTLFYDAPSRGTVPQTRFTTVLSPQGFFANAGGAGSLLNRSQGQATQFAEQNHAIITNLAGEFDTGPFTHRSVIGMECDWFIVNHDQFLSSIPAFGDNPLIIDPNQPDPYAGGPINSIFTFDNPGFRQKRFGWYAQDLIDITDRLKFMDGARIDLVNQVYNRTLLFGPVPIFGPASTHQQFEKITPRAGFVYDIVPEALALYAAYTKSFVPPGGAIFAQTGQPFVPEIGETWEAGFKTDLFDDLTFTAAAFHTERDNVSTQISNFNVIQAANVRSQGLEFNLVGNWTDRLSTSSNYTFADVIQEGPAAFPAVNGRVRGVPRNLANLWTRYNFVQNRDRTLGAAIGMVYVGERRGDYATPLVLDAYTRHDAGLFAQFGNWDTAAYFENIFDVRYETGSIGQYQIYPGAPLNFRKSAQTSKSAGSAARRDSRSADRGSALRIAGPRRAAPATLNAMNSRLFEQPASGRRKPAGPMRLNAPLPWGRLAQRLFRSFSLLAGSSTPAKQQCPSVNCASSFPSPSASPSRRCSRPI